jgi:hypothetical protein
MADRKVPDATILIRPLTLQQYDQFRGILGRVPGETPDRFNVIAQLMYSNHSVDHTPAAYQTVHNKIRVTYGLQQLESPHRDVLDHNDYGKFVVIAIPDTRGGHCRTPPTPDAFTSSYLKMPRTCANTSRRATANRWKRRWRWYVH